MPVIECTALFVSEHKNSWTIECCFTRSPEPLVFGKSICKLLERKIESVDGHNMLKLDVPQWLLSKMVKEYHLDDYKVKICI